MSRTIAAISTATGAGAIAIVRVTGDDALAVARSVFRPKNGELSHRTLVYGKIVTKDGALIDEGLAVIFKAPNSYTREDMLELHCHGGGASARETLNACLDAGAHPAEPGEFTRRAFLSGRIDLSQAEAVMRVISAQSGRAARLAARQAQGALSRGITAAQAVLLGQIARLEAAIDYPEDDLEESTALETAQVAGDVIGKIDGILKSSKSAIRMMEGAKVAIAGRPNAGKSSLLNSIIGFDRAIVSDIPGTTRDVLIERIAVNGFPLTLIDTAGLRDSNDEIERIGVEKARREVESADVTVLVWDRGEPLTDEDISVLNKDNVILAANKTDLLPIAGELPKHRGVTVEVSALTGEGVDKLIAAICSMCTGDVSLSEAQLISERQADAANEAADALRCAKVAAESGFPPECLCEDLKRAWKSLGLITGETADDALLDRIFSEFCLGK